MCLKILLWLNIATVLLLGGLFWAILTNRFPAVPDVPELEDVWFGDGSRPAKEDTSIRPFKINISDAELDDFWAHLKSDVSRMKSAPVNPLIDNFDYGMNSKFLMETVVPYWMNEYSWRESEKKMNNMGDHFLTNIEGMDVHFVRVKPDPVQSKTKKVVPILMAHGWPGTFMEFSKVAPLLTKTPDDLDFVFEVIAPGIPGFAFSSPPKKPGFHFGQCAKVYKKLMDRLGYTRFYLQAADWGEFVAAAMAVLYPEAIIGYHTNMAISRSPSAILKSLLTYVSPRLVVEEHEDRFVVPFLQKLGHIFSEQGYLHMQSTRPDTIGIAIHNTPLGSASYFIEKAALYDSSNNGGNAYLPDGGLPSRWPLDPLLDMLMVYWFNAAWTTSMRFYREGGGRSQHGANKNTVDALNRIPVTVPTGIAITENELLVQPKSIVSDRYPNVFTYHELPKTGHFSALQSPVIFASSVREFVSKVEDFESKKMAAGKSEL